MLKNPDSTFLQGKQVGYLQIFTSHFTPSNQIPQSHLQPEKSRKSKQVKAMKEKQKQKQVHDLKVKIESVKKIQAGTNLKIKN